MPAITRAEYKKSVCRIRDLMKGLVIACSDASIDTKNNACISFMEILYMEDSVYLLLEHPGFRPKLQEKCNELLNDPLASDYLCNIISRVMKRFDL